MHTPYRTLAVVLSVLIGITLFGSTLMGGMFGTGTMMPGMMGYAGAAPWLHMSGWTMGIGMGLMWLTTFAFWGALIVGGVLLVKWLSDTSTRSQQ